MTEKPICVIWIDKTGEQYYLVCGAARLLVIDERTPGDRVSEISARINSAQLSELIGGEAIGHSADQRNSVVAARINSALGGRFHLILSRGYTQWLRH